MASTSSSSSSSNIALPRANGSKYDVFLSFRGEDTRHSFTDHLYNALKQAGILTFRDNDDAERGEELKEEIEKAIKASDASIIVLSGNYATSTWCLDELSLILDQRRDCNHFVLPVFYHVDPSNVGKQKGSFEIQADPSKRRWSDDNVERWKAALTEVVGVIGMTLVGSETKFIKEVVDTIYKRLDRKEIHIPANITGMDVRYEEVKSLLNQSKAQFLVICGMAGSGKSTLAQYIVYLEGQQFESNSIVEKIGSRCKNSHEMVVLQEQLCSDISKGKQDRRIDTVWKGTAHIEVLLERTKALIVLDEIVEEQHLEELLGSGNINKESKIIITTNNDISNWFVSKSKRLQKYTMRLLNDDEALELLSLHAFRSKLPKDGYTGLAQQVLRYCGGNPLALEVLGSSLSKNDTITSWESELSSFEKSFHDKMYEVFIRSYNSLPSSSEKELFLHIACFFVGNDMSYVVKILEPDYAAESKIKTLTKRCFLYVTQDNKLMMHRLLQDMGRSLVDRESRIISGRTRVWRNKDSYEILRRKKSSNTIEGLALDIQMLIKEDGFESRHQKELSTDSLQQMDQLKLLKLNFVKLIGSYEHLSEHLRWLCWVGFSETTIHTDLFMGNMVALDMSYSRLKKFEPPMVLPSLKLLNLKDSHNLIVISNIDQIPNLETLILWNCDSLVHVCETIGNLGRLALLNMTGCTNLFKVEKTNASVELETSTSCGERTQEQSFPLPHSLQRVFLNECNLECTQYFPLSFSDQLFLQYINLGNGLFEILPTYNGLNNLRVLDLRNCSKLKRLLCLPSTLAELYIYDCVSIEKIAFESGQFTLQEFGYEGCVILSEIEGLIKLLLITNLDESDLGHMIWLKEYQYHEVCLVGDYELTKGRSCYLQMLYEFNIMSTSLPNINHPNLTPEYQSQSTLLSFDVPACPRSSRLKGLNVTFRYTISGEDWVWFAKIRSTNGVDVMYSPKVFGRPGIGQVGIWLSYWPIGNLLDVGDEVNVSIVVMSGVEVLECGVSLVYTDEDVAPEILKNETGWVETFGRDLSGFQLKRGSFYLCQRDFYKIMEVGRLTPGWLSILVGDTIDDTEVRGWRVIGRPQQSYQSFKELKTGRYIIHGQEMEEIDKIAEIYSSSFVDKTEVFPSSIHDETTILRTASELSDMSIEYFDQQFIDISEAPVINETMEFTSSSLQEKDSAISEYSKLKTKEESGKFVDIIMPLESATLTDKMKSATTFVSTDTETKVEGTGRVSKMNTKLRSVRCPKCRNVLPEPPEVQVYECGGCGAKLKSRNISEASVINDSMEYTASSLQEKVDPVISESSKLTTKEEIGKFVDKRMPLEPHFLRDRMKSAIKFVSTDTETKVEATGTVSGAGGDGEDDRAQKKMPHRVIERRRRQEMKMLYAKLTSLLPIEFIKGNRSISDHVHQAVHYIKQTKENVKGLSTRRDILKNNERSMSHLLNTVSVTFCHGARVEILINSCTIEDGFHLSRVLKALVEEGLNVTNCTSSKANDRLLHSIQCEANLASVDLSMLQERLMFVANTQPNYPKGEDRWDHPGPMHLLMPTGPFPKDPAPSNELLTQVDLISQELGSNPTPLTGQVSFTEGEWYHLSQRPDDNTQPNYN